MATSADPCPYVSLPKTASKVLVSDLTLCPAGNEQCVVDSQSCKVLSSRAFTAVGSIKDYPRDYITISASFTDVNMDMTEYSTLLKRLYFEDAMFRDDTTFSNLPVNLTALQFQNGNLKSLRRLVPIPTTLKHMYFDGNYLSDDYELSTLLPRALTWSLRNNSFTQLVNHDWSRATDIRLGHNYKLRTIKAVQFGSFLTNLDLSWVNLTNWIVDATSFTYLNALKPNTSELFGYAYISTKITSGATECGKVNGTLRELWADKTMRIPAFNTEVFTVCVTPAPPTTAPATQTLAASPKGWVYALIAVAVVAPVAIFAFIMHRRRMTRKGGGAGAASQTQYTRMSNAGGSSGDSGPRSDKPDSSGGGLNLRCLEPSRLDANDVILHQLVGTGAFADVWRGAFHGTPVAVKVLRSTHVSPSQIQTFVEEIQLMASFDSPYVVKLVGACWTKPSDLQCVMELMDGGDLKAFLAGHAAADVPWEDDKIKLMHDMAEGLVYLHSLNVIHRDLKSRNVLLTGDHTAVKLTDFGVSKEDMQATMTTGVGTFRWMAPEVLQEKHYTISADIYSFGMVVSELSTHTIPYVDLMNEVTGKPLGDSAIMLKVVAGDIKPTFATDTPFWVTALAMACLAKDPAERPTAIQIAYHVQKHLKVSKA